VKDFSEANAAEIISQGPPAEPQSSSHVYVHVPLFVIGLPWAVIRRHISWNWISRRGSEGLGEALHACYSVPGNEKEAKVYIIFALLSVLKYLALVDTSLFAARLYDTV
jgi:hypothetical protein